MDLQYSYFCHIHLPMKKRTEINQVWISAILGLVIFLVTFPKFVPVYGTGLDPSYVWALNYLFVHDYDTLTSLIYPVGPLGFLKYVAAFENNLFFGLLVFSIVKLCFIFLLIILSYQEKKQLNVLRFLVILTVSYFSGIDFSIIGSTVILLLIFINKPSHYYLFFFANVFALFGLFVKSSNGIAAYSAIFTFLLITFIYKNFNVKWITYMILISLVVFITGGVFIFKGITLFLLFLEGLLHLAGGYASGLALFPDNNWWLLSGFIITILIFPFIVRQRNDRIAFLLLLLPLYSVWKHAMGREDIHHVFVMATFLFIFWGIIFLYVEKIKFWYFVFPLLTIFLFNANMHYANLYKGYNINVNGITNFNAAWLKYASFNEKYKAISKDNIRKNVLNDTFRTQIGKEKIDVYPWDHSFVPANNFNWQPRKTLELGASTTNWLSEKNAAKINGEKGPQYILFHLIPDKWGGNFGSLDRRYILNDEPQYIFSLLNNYRINRKNKQVLLFEKTNKKVLTREIFKKETVEWNRWIPVPQRSELTRLKVQIDKTFLLKTKSIFYKDEGYFIDYRLEDNRILSYRFNASTAQDGLWINPLILNPEAGISDPTVNKIRFRSTNHKLLKDEISLEWENIHLSPSEYFDNGDSTRGNYVFQVKEEFELTDDKKYKLNATQSFSSWHSAMVLPGKYLSVKKISLDTLWKDGIEKLVAETSLMYFVSKKGTSGAVLVIQVKDAQTDFWKSFPLSGDEIPNEWKYAYLEELIDADNHQNGSLAIYVWNNGADTLYVDDFTIGLKQE